MEALIALLLEYRYVILFPLACIEGPMLGFVSGVLVSLGHFNPLIAYPLLIAADVIPDIAYYFFGRFGKRRNLVEKYGHKVRVTPEHMDSVQALWHNHPVKAMMITKFSYGLSTPLLILAGLVHLPFQKFVVLSTLLAALQYGVLMGLGYFFGGSFAFVESTLVRVQILVAGVVVLFVVYYVFTKSIRQQFWDRRAK